MPRYPQTRWLRLIKSAEVTPDAQAGEGRVSDEQLRYRHAEQDISEVLDALHLNLAAPEPGFPNWNNEIADFVRSELSADEDAVAEVRHRLEWHRKRAAQLHPKD